jgi:hypothetical protein
MTAVPSRFPRDTHKAAEDSRRYIIKLTHYPSFRTQNGQRADVRCCREAKLRRSNAFVKNVPPIARCRMLKRLLSAATSSVNCLAIMVACASDDRARFPSF